MKIYNHSHEPREEQTGERRKVHNKQRLNFHFSSNIISVISSRGTGRAEHVARMRDEKLMKILIGKAQEKR
jgi:hypothetical protein